VTLVATRSILTSLSRRDGVRLLRRISAQVLSANPFVSIRTFEWLDRLPKS
jgi:hypothetical protein